MLTSSDNWKSKTASQLRTFVPDALQFLLHNKLMIEEAPLQLYVSALIFSPNSSEVRKRYRREMPSWILNEPRAPYNRKRSLRGLSIAHHSAIHSVAISPDGTLVATACGDCMIYIWDLASGIERLRLEGSPDGVANVCFSPDRCLVAAFSQNCVSTWNIEAAFDAIIQPDCQFRFERQGSGTASSRHPKCAISLCGNLVTVVDYPHDVWVWDMKAKQVVKHHFQVESQRFITGVFFSSDDSLLICVTVPSDKSEPNEILHAWRTSTGVGVPTDSLGITPWSKHLFSFGGAHLIITGATPIRNIVAIRIDEGDSIRATFVSADGEFLEAGANGSEITLWVRSRQKMAYLKHGSSEIKSIEFSPNGKYLISANSFDELRIWNIEAFWSKPSRFGFFWEAFTKFSGAKQLRRKLFLNPDEGEILSSWVVDVWIRSRDGSLLATRPRNGRIVTIWDMKTGAEKFRLNVGKHTSDLRFSESGNVFTVRQKSSVEFWQTKTGQKGDILNIDRHKSIEAVGSAQVSDNGRKISYPELVVLDDQIFTNLCVWELDGLRRISSLKIPFSRFTSVQIAFSPNEELYCLWEKESAVVEIRSYPGTTLQCINLQGNTRWVGFLPDGKDILIISELNEERKHAIHIWNVEQKEISVYFPLDVNCDIFYDDVSYSAWTEHSYGPQYTKAFISPDGKLLALGRRQSNHVEISLLKISDPKSLFRLIDLPKILNPNDIFSDENVVYDFIQFAPCGTHINTERGSVLLPGASPPHKLLFATRSWIQEDGEDIIAIPPEYQLSLFGISGHTITFRDNVNGPWFVVLDKGVKTMTP